ncbi:hypothetical protein TREPR_2060 [Treponema primitia ZAS-2]|uniref:Uncharacterized protein n=1 Tax=Treponema primitia (strain ATCC BAA-887 / DSM 12427 / ZAS-2) TaxID=545694 RepID=F5YJS7_TREPZ|nr:hypothetical protein [Treponema primitia]AEF85413.1 hypothetical protein TREPR_2060 [Treponema primitia ZAS-2]
MRRVAGGGQRGQVAAYNRGWGGGLRNGGPGLRGTRQKKGGHRRGFGLWVSGTGFRDGLLLAGFRQKGPGLGF